MPPTPYAITEEKITRRTYIVRFYLTVANYPQLFKNETSQTYYLNRYYGAEQYFTFSLDLSNKNDPVNVFFYQVVPIVHYTCTDGPNNGNTVVHIHGYYFKKR